MAAAGTGRSHSTAATAAHVRTAQPPEPAAAERMRPTGPRGTPPISRRDRARACRSTNQQARSGTHLTGHQSAGTAEHAPGRGAGGANREGARAPGREKPGLRCNSREPCPGGHRDRPRMEKIFGMRLENCAPCGVCRNTQKRKAAAWCSVIPGCCRAAGPQTPLSGLLKGIPEEI